ncbi:hypothetical protein H4R35_007203 [Dimargaris xerosporica]|nr:hypothetical protein H4R35_007561 [Dimargaris xerosporica]KAJ1963839.1 hypothetical protein H4R35_007203 [Dimargaris xerosporica]
MQSRTPRRVLPSMLKALPVEVYPLVAVLSFAVMAGGTAGVHKLLTDPSLRRQGATGSFRHAREENTE